MPCLYRKLWLVMGGPVLVVYHITSSSVTTSGELNTTNGMDGGSDTSFTVISTVMVSSAAVSLSSLFPFASRPSRASTFTL